MRRFSTSGRGGGGEKTQNKCRYIQILQTGKSGSLAFIQNTEQGKEFKGRDSGEHQRSGWGGGGPCD